MNIQNVITGYNNSILETLRNIENAKKEWEQTMDCIEDIVMVTDTKGIIVRTNRTLVNITGLDFKDFLGRPWKEILNQHGFFEQIKEAGDMVEYSYRGSKWYILREYPMERLVKTGEPGFVVMLKDITERRMAEVTLENEKQRFKTLVESAPLGIAEIDTKGNYTYINPKFVEIFGYDGGDFKTGKECFRLFFPDPVKRNEAIYAWFNMVKSLENREKHFETFEVMCKDGSIKTVKMALVMLKHKDNGGKEYILFFEDITERVKIENEIYLNNIALDQKNKELESAYNQLKSAQSRILQQDKMASIGQLAAGVAHEINNPISFIMSNLNSLNRYMGNIKAFIESINDFMGSTDQKNEAFNKPEMLWDLRRNLKVDYIMNDIFNIINESLEGVERVKKIVQDLKTFSHVDESEQKMGDINKGLESTINIVWNEIKYKATVIKRYGDIPLTKCNLGQLNQVFMNILINASQAIEKHGEITVKTWHDGTYIYISISDTGCGIPEDKIDRIYEPFFTTKEVGKGTGLGLSIAYDIIRKHKGEITVKSEVGKGTEFIIKIPIVRG
ncbi:MAG: PAS domain S-box protein [Syntrophorhabdaceae bacterium]|nr:PAS domain S-box protein [Syntrophorhabdaceae bacterium]